MRHLVVCVKITDETRDEKLTAADAVDLGISGVSCIRANASNDYSKKRYLLLK